MAYVISYFRSFLPTVLGGTTCESSQIINVENLSITSEVLKKAKNNLKKTGANLFENFPLNIEEEIVENVNEFIEEDNSSFQVVEEDISLIPGRNAPNGINITKILNGEFKPHERMIRVISVSKETICDTISKLKPTKINEHTPISNKNATLKELDAAFAMGVFNFLSSKKLVN